MEVDVDRDERRRRAAEQARAIRDMIGLGWEGDLDVLRGRPVDVHGEKESKFQRRDAEKD